MLSVAQRGELTAAEASYWTQVNKRPTDASAWTNLGITRERVRQLEARALRELRSVAPGLEFYLRS